MRGSLASVIVMGAALVGCGSGKVSIAADSSARAAPRVTRIAWDGINQLGLAVVIPAPNRVWLVTIASENDSNLWQLNPRTRTVRPVPIDASVQELVANTRAVWALAGNPNRVTLFYGQAADAPHFQRRAQLPAGCRSPIAEIFAQQLWVSCGRAVLVYAPRGRALIKRLHVHPPATIFATRTDLWHAGQTSLRSLAGRNKGKVIHLPVGSDRVWSIARDEAWTLETRDSGATILTRIRLPSGDTRQFTLTTRGLQPDLFEVAGDEIWMTTLEKPIILRYKRRAPHRPIAILRLPAVTSRNFDITLARGGRYLWADTQNDSEQALYRIEPPDTR